MRREVDVAVIGGGLAGSALAATLSARGYDVALTDLHATYPSDFRAEKLTRMQVGQLRRLGLWARVRPIMTPIDTLATARFGRIVERRANDEWGFDYADLVNAVRATLPSERCAYGRVARIESSSDRRTVKLSDGREIAARLAVIATGLGKGLLDGLGIGRKVIQADHCLAIGFDIVPDRAASCRSALPYHGEKLADRSAYLTLFPIGDRLRANLFVYRQRDDDWSRSFRGAPRQTLCEMMPGLVRLIGGFTIAGQPVLRPIDLHAAEDYRRDGIVLVGDAFATTCPTGGTGIDKVLTDVDRLAALVPHWLAADQLGADSVGRFYADPAKVACDENARRMITYARAMATDPGLTWTLRRYRNFYAQALRHRVRQTWQRPQRNAHRPITTQGGQT